MSKHVYNHDDLISEHFRNHDDLISEHICNHDDLISKHVYIVEFHNDLNVMRDI